MQVYRKEIVKKKRGGNRKRMSQRVRVRECEREVERNQEKVSVCICYNEVRR